MHPDTFDVLVLNGCANKDNFAFNIAALLESRKVSMPGDVDRLAMIVDEIRDSLFGNGYGDHVIEELNEQIGEMTRPKGAVYTALNIEMSLCTAVVKRKATTADGATIVVQKNGRFASDDPDVVAQFRLRPMFDRLERTMERAAETIGEDIERIPALATRTPAMLARANRVMQHTLPAPRQNGQS